jgi:hypothetical protein
MKREPCATRRHAHSDNRATAAQAQGSLHGSLLCAAIGSHELSTVLVHALPLEVTSLPTRMFHYWCATTLDREVQAPAVQAKIGEDTPHHDTFNYWR